MKLTTSQFDKNDKSVEALAARNKVLRKEIDEQTTKIDTLRKALQNAATSFGENDRRTQNWQIQLNNAEAALNDMNRELDENEKAIKEGGKAAEESGSKFEGFGKVLKTVGVALGAVAVAAGAAAVKLGKEVIAAYADYEQLVGGVDTLFKDSSQEIQRYAANAYKTAGLSANEYMETVTGFSASLIQSLGGDTEKAAKYADMAITDMSDNANKMGTDMSSIQNAYQGFAKQNYTMLDNLKLGYGGTKQEMERLLADAEKISGVKYDISSYADVVEAIHVMQESMDIAGTTAKEAEATISGSVNALKSAVSNLIVGFGDADADMELLCNNMVDAFKTVVANITPVIENIVAALPTALDALIYRTPTSPQITSVKQIVDEKSQQTYAEAESLFVKGKLIDAYPLFKKAADNNCARAYYYLGEYYAEGYGHIVGNKSEALEYWRKGMSLGDILSTYQYGLLKYEDSEPLLNKWVKEHIHAVLQLVKENDSAAIVEFGWYILSKNPKDIGTLVDSLGYFKKAADNGYWPGAKMFYQFTEDLRRTGTNLQDYTALIQDVEHYETHALIGCTELFYKDDYVDSARHFQKSLWLRDDVVEPAGYLAFVLNTGLVPDSLADGFSRDIIPMYYNAGLKSDNAFTHYQLGALYYNGIGEKNYGKDLKKAYECFERSYSILPQGFVAGQLGYMFLTGEGVEENDKMAIHYLVEGDRLGDLNATMILSQCYEHGFGVKKDLQKSKALSERGKQLSAPDTSTILKSYVEPMMTKHKEEEN